LRAPQQRRGEASGHEEAHEIAAELLRHVDADDGALGADRRAAAHAGIERARKMDAFVVAALDETVIGAFDDGEAEIERIAHGIEALALGELAAERPRIEVEERHVAAVEVHHRKIVGEVDGEQRELAARAVGGGVFKTISLGLERYMRDDVVVGDGKSVAAHQEARSQRGLPSRR
jgi:hypothetical protein